MELKDLSVEEVNVILQALAKQPYETVSALITKVKDQGEAQLKNLQTEKVSAADVEVV